MQWVDCPWFSSELRLCCASDEDYVLGLGSFSSMNDGWRWTYPWAYSSIDKSIIISSCARVTQSKSLEVVKSQSFIFSRWLDVSAQRIVIMCIFYSIQFRTFYWDVNTAHFTLFGFEIQMGEGDAW